MCSQITILIVANNNYVIGLNQKEKKTNKEQKKILLT